MADEVQQETSTGNRPFIEDDEWNINTDHVFARFYFCAVSVLTFSKEFELATLCHAGCVSSVVLNFVLDCFYIVQEDLLTGMFIGR